MDDVIIAALGKGRVDIAKGMSPCVANPAEKVTACPSAIPRQRFVQEIPASSNACHSW
jgi:hypothetical protein